MSWKSSFVESTSDYCGYSKSIEDASELIRKFEIHTN
jgi:hypothetical protein